MTVTTIIDIETVPDQEDGAFDRYLSAVQPPANYKKQETIDKWMAENAEAEAEKEYLKTGLNGLRGQICSIAFAVSDREPVCVSLAQTKMDESMLLRTFWMKLQQEIEQSVADLPGPDERARFARIKWIGHNLLDFDLRFLKQRSIIRGIKPLYFIPADAKHGGDLVYDTMKEWAGWRGYVKLDELVEAMGIEPPQWAVDAGVVDCDGSQVWEMFRHGDFEKIAGYNLFDVWKTREVYKCLTFVGRS